VHQPQVTTDNLRQYLCFDLCTGRLRDDHPLLPFLEQHGVTPNVLGWFTAHAVTFDIFGANFYPWSYGRLVPDGRGKLRPEKPKRRTHGGAIAGVLSDAWSRYHLPVMVTETSANEPIEGRALWMDETIAAVQALRAEKVPVVGYTWFPMMTMIDWAYRKGHRPIQDYLLHLGLFDSHFDENGVLRREPTALVERYQGFNRTT
jgi:hypothetical protein